MTGNVKPYWVSAVDWRVMRLSFRLVACTCGCANGYHAFKCAKTQAAYRHVAHKTPPYAFRVDRAAAEADFKHPYAGSAKELRPAAMEMATGDDACD